MDGTFAPLKAVVDVLDEVFTGGDAYLVVDEAHATGVYGPDGRGRVALEGLEGHPRVLARLCTFGKALGGSGAVVTAFAIESYQWLPKDPEDNIILILTQISRQLPSLNFVNNGYESIHGIHIHVHERRHSLYANYTAKASRNGGCPR
ncbi:hypothetical protein PQX77_018574 [Marasmius sp. AFHP31]|nr:hypothetical protein PQX77_018574 [Marasmius sp. AFHP31]